MKHIIIAFAFLMLFPVCILAQEHHHSHGRNEIGISPGVTYSPFEVGYDLIHLEHFHFGPAIDYSWSRHDTHFMFGVHCAYAF